jgi:hypothetical protein
VHQLGNRPVKQHLLPPSRDRANRGLLTEAPATQEAGALAETKWTSAPRLRP